jgi:hypothetical protein
VIVGFVNELVVFTVAVFTVITVEVTLVPPDPSVAPKTRLNDALGVVVPNTAE